MPASVTGMLSNLTCGFRGVGKKRLPSRSSTPVGPPPKKGCCARLGTLAQKAWNSNVSIWCRTHGLFASLYFIVGVVVYGYLEEWTPVNTCYFLLVSSTTIGFGDMSPGTQWGRGFTSFYVIVGIFTLMSALAPIVHWFLEYRKHLEKAIEAAAEVAEAAQREKSVVEKAVDVAVVSGAYNGAKASYEFANDKTGIGDAATNMSSNVGGATKNGLGSVGGLVKSGAKGAGSLIKKPFASLKSAGLVVVVDNRLAALADADGDGVIDEEEMQAIQGAKISYTSRYLRALSGPILVFAIGMLISLFVLELGLVDSTYFVTTTMTTIGYGGINFLTADGKELPVWIRYVGIFYLPIAVTALADAASELARLAVRRKICETDYAGKVDKLLLEEAKGNPLETLTEAEFLISVLKSHDLVDDATLRAIRIQFAKITRHRSVKPGEDAVLDAKAVFDELVAQGRIVDIENASKKSKDALADVDEGPPEDTQSTLAKAGEAALAVIKAPITLVQVITDVPGEDSQVGTQCEVDFRAYDGGYKEWYKEHWLPRVYGRDDLKSSGDVFGDDLEGNQALLNPGFKLLSTAGTGRKAGAML